MPRPRFEKKSKTTTKPHMNTTDPVQWNAKLKDVGLAVLDTTKVRPPRKRPWPVTRANGE